MTTYDKVYSRFLNKIEDFDFLNLYKDEPELVKGLMNDFLKSAIPKFTLCIKDLFNRDDEGEFFNEDLSETEQEILAIYMIAEYLSPKIFRSELIEQRIGSRDYQMWSPANQMGVIMEAREKAMEQARSLEIEYHYTEGFLL